MRLLRRLSGLLLVFACWSPSAWGQAHRLLPPDDPALHAIERLQRRGHLLNLNPTALPYRMGAVAAAVAALDTTALSRLERRWARLVHARVTPAGEPDMSAPVRAGVALAGGARLTDHTRLDPLRPLGDMLRFYPVGQLELWMEAGPVVAAVGSRHDLFYDRDPDGLDLALRAGARSENAYVGLHTRYADLYLGRFAQHWGLAGGDAPLLSDNPMPYDRLALRLGTTRLSVRGVLGELDSMTEDGRFTGRADDFFETGLSVRRYLAAHRWDWRPGRRLSLAFVESVVYSGPNSGPSLKFMNPLQPFVLAVDNRPKNDENNGMVGGLLWAQTGGWTLHGQLILDDLDIINLGREPTSFALTANLVRVFPTFDLGASFTAVASRTYNTDQPEGTYIYLLRGLGTQFNDYVRAGVYADVYLDGVLPGLQVTPRLEVLAQGEEDPRGPFPAIDGPVGTILTGTAERVVRPCLQVRLQPAFWWWIQLDGGVNLASNVDHLEGQDETRFAGVVTFGFRLQTGRGLEAGW